MAAGGKKNMHLLKEKAERQWTVNCSVSARNLRKTDIGAVIFGCQHSTIKECKTKNLFGLPSAHFSYVKNVTPGLVLFLFNYSDRKLHGIFEATSPGQLNIDPYGWATDSGERTPYPAQVRMRVRSQCRPLCEQEFAPIISDNYYKPHHFWFELNQSQTRQLINRFLSSPIPSSHFSHPSQNTAAGSTLHNALPISDTEEIADHGLKGLVLEDVVNNPDEVGTGWDTQEKATENFKPGGEYASVLSSKNNFLPQKSWSSLFKASAAPEAPPEEEILKRQTSNLIPLSDNSNSDVERQTSWFSSSLYREDQGFGDCMDEWDADASMMHVRNAIGIKSEASALDLDHTGEPNAEWESSCITVSGLNASSVNDAIEVNKSEASELDLDHAGEPNAEWESSCITVSGLNASSVNDAIEVNNNLEIWVKDSGAQPCDFLSMISQLAQEVQELKGSYLTQNMKILSLERQLVQSNTEVQNLRKQFMMSSKQTPSSNGQVEEVGFEAYYPFPQLEESIIVIGGYDGRCWLSDSCLYSTIYDLVKPLKPMTFLRSHSSAALLNGELYLFGGGHGETWYDTVESYNLTHNQWVTRPSLNQKKGRLAGVSIFDKLYAIGGENGIDCISEVEMFDANVGSWTFTKSMQQGRLAPGVATINGVLYVVGGYDRAKYLNSVERFDPREPKWTELESMGTARGCLSLTALNEKLYALGGYDGRNIVSTVEIFDPRGGSWMVGEPMKDARGSSAAAVIGGKIYAVGGVSDGGRILDSIEYYEEGHGWKTTNLKALGNRSFFSAIVL